MWQQLSTVSKVPAAEYFVKNFRIWCQGCRLCGVVPTTLAQSVMFQNRRSKNNREPKGKIVRKMFKYRLYPTRPQTEALIGTTVRSVPPLQRCASRAHRGVSNAPQIYQLLRPSGTVDRNSQSRRPRSSQLPLCSRCAEALRESIQGVFSTHQARTEARVSSLQIVSSLRSHHFPQPR